MGKLILILGGARSGKSTTAERMARTLGGDSVLYIATAEALDEEMRARIAAHKNARPATWQTLEAPRHIAEQLEGIALPDVVLLDCITLLANNVVMTLPEDCEQSEANGAMLDEIAGLLKAIQLSHSLWIVVSNEVGMGVVPPYRLGRIYRDMLGAANQRLAQHADEVLLMVAGLPWYLKPAGV